MHAGACAACHSCLCASSALPHACPHLMHIDGCHARPDQASKPCVPNPGASGRAGHGGAAAAEGPAGGRGERARAGLAAGAPGRVRRGLPRVAAHAGALTHGDAAAPLSVTPGLLCALARAPFSAVCEGSRLGGDRKAVCSADPACTQPRRAVSKKCRGVHSAGSCGGSTRERGMSAVAATPLAQRKQATPASTQKKKAHFSLS